MEKRWWGTRPSCNTFQFEKFGFSQTILAFVVLSFGVMLACVSLMSEIVMRNVRNKNKALSWEKAKNKDTHQNNRNDNMSIEYVNQKADFGGSNNRKA